MKYKLTDETITTLTGKTLFRIQAMRDIPSHEVKAGDFGGYVESENNLSHDDDAWVFDNARVYGNAQVYGNARVFDNARVFGNAQVYDNAWVYGDARVYGKGIIC